MSYYSSRSNGVTEDDSLRRYSRIRNARGSGTDLNSNNNNNDTPKSIGSRISGYPRNTSDYSHRTSSSRLALGRKKSSLVESMAANFEQKKAITATPAPSISITKPTASQSHNNGFDEDTSPVNKRNADTGPKIENGNSLKPDDDLEDDPPIQTRQKSAISQRRGKQQREKRMLRQKRRSTGVVRLKDDDEEEKKKEDTSEKSTEKTEQNDDELRISETDTNTKTNELSPSAINRHSPNERSSYRSDTYDRSSTLTSSLKSSTAYTGGSSYSYKKTSDSVFLSSDSNPVSPSLPDLNSSRRRGNRLSSDKLANDNYKSSLQDKKEMEELKQKLAAAEKTVAKLTKEMATMDSDLHHLEEENERLKTENKMLEDENMTMLRLMKS